jgi:predicted nucleic acid-binding protein
VSVTLDTSDLVDLLRGDRAVVSLVVEQEAKGESFVVSSIAAFELLFGVEVSGSRTERARLRSLLTRFEDEPLDSPCAESAAELRAEFRRRGRTPGLPDILIAGQALAHAHVLVTRDALLRETAGAVGVRVLGY